MRDSAVASAAFRAVSAVVMAAASTSPPFLPSVSIALAAVIASCRAVLAASMIGSTAFFSNFTFLNDSQETLLSAATLNLIFSTPSSATVPVAATSFTYIGPKASPSHTSTASPSLACSLTPVAGASAPFFIRTRTQAVTLYSPASRPFIVAVRVFSPSELSSLVQYSKNGTLKLEPSLSPSMLHELI